MKKVLLTALVSSFVYGGSLPTGLSQADVGRVVQVIGTGGAARLLRSTEAYRPFPGIKFGMEVTVVPPKDLNDLGDGNGSLPSLNPSPRLYLAKGLFSNLELILNFFPSSVFNSISTVSGLLKFAYFEERANWLNGGLYGGITHISAYSSTYSGNDLELGATVSKDFVKLKPFAGLGVLMAKGSVPEKLAKDPKQNAASNLTLHAFLGMEVETPANLSFQIDLFNLLPSASLFVGKKF